jgi:amino acid transporter
MAAEAPTAGRKLFTRQSSGLVREVSVTNALFYNTCAFVGGGAGWYPVAYTLAFVPVGLVGLSTYGWWTVLTGAFMLILGLIFASLSSVMPRSGGDYVFTSRFVPKVGPFIGWVESFTLAFAALAIIAFEVPLVLIGLQVTGRIIGIGTGADFFERANNWFAEDGIIKGIPGFIGALIVLALITWVVLQPTRRFHRIVTGLAVIALASVVLMFVFGLLFTNTGDFVANLPTYADGITVDQLVAVADNAGVNAGNNVDVFPLSIFSFMGLVILLNFIGFQYSAYIAGEVRGNVKRGVMVAVLGALGIGMLMNTFYVDLLARRVGFEANLGWGLLYWGYSADAPLPLGQPNLTHLTAAIANPDLWPIWALVSLGGTLFPFLLCPVYINFLSRMALAWSLDRRVPEWFGNVSERLRAPVNAIIAFLAIAVLFAVLQNFAILPEEWSPAFGGRLSLATTLFFSILMALLTWVMPGVNALLAPFTRPDLMASAPWRPLLPALGVLWGVFAGILYWFAGLKPVIESTLRLPEEGTLEYFNRSGISFAIIITALSVVIYAIVALRNRLQGVDTAMIYKEIPPE